VKKAKKSEERDRARDEERKRSHSPRDERAPAGSFFPNFCSQTGAASVPFEGTEKAEAEACWGRPERKPFERRRRRLERGRGRSLRLKVFQSNVSLTACFSLPVRAIPCGR